MMKKLTRQTGSVMKDFKLPIVLILVLVMTGLDLQVALVVVRQVVGAADRLMDNRTLFVALALWTD